MLATTRAASLPWFQGKKRLRSDIGITLTLVMIWQILQRYLSPLSLHTYERRISFSSNEKIISSNNITILLDHDDPYLNIMVNDIRLARSAQHQSKFLALRNDSLPYFFPREIIFPTITGRAAAFILNTEFAYIHVWKSGGTTIQDQTERPQLAIEDIQNQSHWVSFVRDPIDHFLSGYSECEFRQYEKNHILPEWDQADYDRRIRQWLKKVKSKTQVFKNMCPIHSFPQINFFIDPIRRKLYPKIKAIGDMSELPVFLERIAKFPYNYTRGSSRVAKENPVKTHYFPARRDLLSNQTLLEICRFVSLDYHFFDFQPPDICKQHGSSVLVTPQKRPLPLKAGEHYVIPKAVQPRIMRRPAPAVVVVTPLAPTTSEEQQQKQYQTQVKETKTQAIANR